MLPKNKRAPARRALACFAAVCLVALLPLRAAAWSDNGHKTVAVIAYSLLTPRAKHNVDALLMGHTVDAVVMWPDELRYIGSPECVTPESEGCNPNYRPETADWHQVDLRYEGSGRFSPQDCPTTREGDCVVAAIEDFKRVLTSATRGKLAEHTPQNRRKYHDALRFMLHFVGDIHQPLHCANRNRDAGGNGVPVTWEDEPAYAYGDVWNLHAVWDDVMVSHDMRKAGKSGFADYAAWLEGGLPAQSRAYAARKSNWITTGQPETTVAWAESSHRLARRYAYDALPKKTVTKSTRGKVATDRNKNPRPIIVLDAAYFDTKNVPVVRQQLTLGGVRLARILNDIFDKDLGW